MTPDEEPSAGEVGDGDRELRRPPCQALRRDVASGEMGSLSARTGRRLGELREHAADYLDIYTDSSGYYAFHTYDQAPTHDGPLTPADIFMANLLSLQMGWREVIPLFADGDTRFTRLRAAIDSALAAARRLPPLECCTVEQALMPELNRAIDLAGNTRPYGWESKPTLRRRW